jgi:hypothetical protein
MTTVKEALRRLKSVIAEGDLPAQVGFPNWSDRVATELTDLLAVIQPCLEEAVRLEELDPKLESNFDSPKMPSMNDFEYFLYRVDTPAAQLAMSPIVGTITNLPFPTRFFEGVKFYNIQGKYWQIHRIDSDDNGLFVEFHRLAGEYTGAANQW